MDWVVQDETWPINAETTGLVTQTNSFVLAPLTVDNFELGGVQQQRYRERQDGKSALTVRGFIHWSRSIVDPGSTASLFARNWQTELVARICVMTTDPESGEIIPPTNFSLRTAATANQDFLWENRLFLANIENNDWQGQSAVRAPWFGTWPVNVKVGRTLRPLENLTLILGWITYNYGIFTDDPLGDVIWTSRVRTLLR